MFVTSKFLPYSIILFLDYISDNNLSTNYEITNTACSSSYAINHETELLNRKEDTLNIPSESNDNRKNKERCLQDTNNFTEITGVRRKNVIHNSEDYKYILQL